MKRTFWLLAATFPVAVVSSLSWFGVFTFVNGYLIRGLGCSNADWTVSMLCLSGGMLFWYPAFTEVSSRAGRRSAVMLGLACATLSFTGIALSRHAIFVNLSLLMMGPAIAAYVVAWCPFVAEYGRERPGQAIARANLVFNLVGAASIIGGAGIARIQDYRLMFLIFAAVCGLCCVVFHILSRGMEDTAKGPAPVSIRMLSRHDVAGLIGGPFLVVMLLGICAAPFAFQTSNQLFPNLARDVHGLSESRIAILVGAGRLPTLISLFALSHIIDRLNTVRWYGAGLLLDGLAIIAIVLAPTAGSAVAAYLTFYLLHGIVWATALPAIDACVPPRLRDAAFALLGMAEIGAVFLVGVAHNRLIVMGKTLGFVFVFCGGLTAAAGFALFVYSHSDHARRAARRCIRAPGHA